MSTLYTVYCDNCHRSTPPLPGGRVPVGWAILQFPDIGPRHLCSYQCLYEYGKKLFNDPPTPHTPLMPEEDPLPPMDCIYHYEPVPEHLAAAIPNQVFDDLRHRIEDLQRSVKGHHEEEH